MDLRFSGDGHHFKFRVCCVIIKNGRVLVDDVQDNGFLCFPGGHVEIGEDSVSAVVREIKEEVGILLTNPKLHLLVENFYNSNRWGKVHEIGLFYMDTDAEVPGDKSVDYYFEEMDKGKLVTHKYKGVDITRVDEFDIRPKVMRDYLKQGNFEFKHIINKEI